MQYRHGGDESQGAQQYNQQAGEYQQLNLFSCRKAIRLLIYVVFNCNDLYGYEGEK